MSGSRMMYGTFCVIILVIAIFLYFGIMTLGGESKDGNNVTQSRDGSAQQDWPTITSSDPPVSVTITPLLLGRSEKTWRFDVTFETHSGSLDDDPTRVVVLSDDGGEEYLPMAWEGPGAGGHHRDGIIVFSAIDPTPTFVVLKVRDVGGVPERSYRWDITK